MSTLNPDGSELTPEQHEANAAAEIAEAEAELAQAQQQEAAEAEAAAAAADQAPAYPDDTPSTASEPNVNNVRTGPAEEQSPVATEADKAIVGDSGMYEQQPLNPSASADQPVRTSAPPAAMQSGVPLPEDRAAGITAPRSN